MTDKEYDSLVKEYSPCSKTPFTIIMAYITGGIICTLGQLCINLYLRAGADEETAFTMASVTLVFAAAVLTGLNIFDNIAGFAGAGTLVPITGFANSIVSPALEFKSEGYILGLGSKMFVIAGPVLVYGLSASVIYGVIIYLLKLY